MDFVRKHALLVFYLLAVGIAFTVNMTVFRSLGSTMPEHVAAAKAAFDLNSFSVLILFHEFGQSLMPLGALFPLAPTIAAVVVVLAVGGREGVGSLLRRFQPWRAGVTVGVATKTYFTLLLGGFGYFCAMIVIDQVYGSSADIEKVMELARLNAPGIALSTFLLATLTDMGAVGEELGWRGFAYPAMLESFRNPLSIAILLGLLWGVWHLPREILALINGQTDLASVLQHQVDFYMNSIALTVIMVYFINRLGGSIWPAIFIHGLSNYTSEMTGLVYVMSHSATDGGYVLPFLEASTLVKVLIAGTIVAYTGPDLGLRANVRESLRLPCLGRRFNQQ